MTSLRDLVEEAIDEREERNLIIDFDSIIFLSAYKYKDEDNEELVYMDCCKRIYGIERELFNTYIIKETKLAMTSSTNFRYELYPEYKQNRKKKDDKAEHLSQLVKKAKRLIYERLTPILVCNSVVEADDTCISYAREKDYIVAAMDSDVVNQCPTPVFNFHSKHYKLVHKGKTEQEISRAILLDSIKGKSKDNVKGVDGAGEKFTTLFVSKLYGEKIDVYQRDENNDIKKTKDGKPVKIRIATKFLDILEKKNISFPDYVELFDTPADCLLQYRLCNCYQYKNNELVLSTIKDIESTVIPF